MAASDGRVQVDRRLLAVARRQRLRRPVLQPGGHRDRCILDGGASLDALPQLSEFRPPLRLRPAADLPPLDLAEVVSIGQGRVPPSVGPLEDRTLAVPSLRHRTAPIAAAVRPLWAYFLLVRRTVFSTGLTTVPVLHRSGRIPGIGIEEPALICRLRLAASTVLGRRGLGVLQHADIALEFGAGQPTAATDVDRT